MKIYETYEPVPNRVVGLAKLLRSAGGKQGVPKDEVLLLMLPKSIREKEHADTLAANTIAAAKELGLVEEYEDDRGRNRLRIATSIQLGKEDDSYDALRPTLTRLVFAPRPDGRQVKFSQICAWFMWQEPASMPQTHGEFKSRMSDHGFDIGDLRLRDNATWEQVVYWMKYLGLMWQRGEAACVGLIPDPSALIVRHLDELVDPHREMPIEEFRSRLGKFCPALDGGEVNVDVARKLVAGGNLMQGPEERLSPALSFALRSLQEDGVLKFWCPDDQRLFLLMSFDEKVAFVSRQR